MHPARVGRVSRKRQRADVPWDDLIESYRRVHAEAMVAGMISAGRLVLARGHREAALAIHGELCRRYVERIGTSDFLDFDAQLQGDPCTDDTPRSGPTSTTGEPSPPPTSRPHRGPSPSPDSEPDDGPEIEL